MKLPEIETLAKAALVSLRKGKLGDVYRNLDVLVKKLEEQREADNG